MINPSEIVEGGVIFSLGKLKGDQVVYDFSKILIYLEAKGKLLFGEHFRIYEDDKGILFRLCNYFIKEESNCKNLGIDINKGILLTGPVGSGKTSLMRLLRHITPHHRPYEVMPTRNITFSFNHIGYKTIEDFGNGSYFCFDDLGVEPTGRFFGKDCNVMGEIL